LGPVHAKVAPDEEELADKLMFSPTHTLLLLFKVNAGIGDPVMQAKPVRILAPGSGPKPLLKLTPDEVR
jgi:hypothetical protein